jgi:hypothetical protein
MSAHWVSKIGCSSGKFELRKLQAMPLDILAIMDSDRAAQCSGSMDSLVVIARFVTRALFPRASVPI